MRERERDVSMGLEEHVKSRDMAVFWKQTQTHLLEERGRHKALASIVHFSIFYN